MCSCALWKERWDWDIFDTWAIMTAILGIVTTGQAFNKTKADLFATRFVVGIFDSGLLPGSVFVGSLYYPGAHRQWRMAMIMVANISSNACGNILAYAIAQISNENSNKWHGWRWVFIVEGCLTFGISAICYYSSIARPETVKFLTAEEKTIVIRDIGSKESTICIVKEIKIFFSNILNYICAATLVFTASTTYSVGLFAPSFVQAFHPHYTIPQVQGQVVPIFVVSAACTVICAWLADCYQHRVGFALGGYIFTIIRFSILRQPSPTKTTCTKYLHARPLLRQYGDVCLDAHGLELESRQPTFSVPESRQCRIHHRDRERGSFHFRVILSKCAGAAISFRDDELACLFYGFVLFDFLRGGIYCC